jgi:hypothetical protein
MKYSLRTARDKIIEDKDSVLVDRLHLFADGYKGARLKFIEGLLSKMRGYEFWQLNYRKDQDLYYVTLPDQEYVVGRIIVREKFDNHRHKVTEFAVESRKIQNWKFTRSADGDYRTLSSTNVARALKNATRYFSPWSPKEAAENKISSFESAIKRLKRIETNKVDNIYNKVVGDYKTDLVHVLSVVAQYTTTPDLTLTGRELRKICGKPLLEQISLLLEQSVETSEVMSKTVGARYDYVVITPRGKIRVTRVESDFLCHTHPTCKIYDSLEDAPHHVQLRVSALYIVEDGTAVLGVGMRVTESIYYVFA